MSNSPRHGRTEVGTAEGLIHPFWHVRPGRLGWAAMKGLPPMICVALTCALAGGMVRAEVSVGGVVERVAGWWSPEFRRNGVRMGEIGRELATLPELAPRPLAWRYGFRSETMTAPDEPQWLQIDLQERRMIDRIVAVPAHIPPLGKQGEGYGFPRRFRIEVSDDPEMKDAITVIDRTAADVANPGRDPADFRIEPVVGRYLRFTSTRHYPTEEGFIWALEELVVLSGNLSVSTWRPVTASSSLEIFPNWSIRRAQDGQSALGLPVTAEPSPTLGYLSALTDDPNERKWLQVDLGDGYPIDEIRLLPVQSGGYETLGGWSFPRGWMVELAEDPAFERIVWSYEQPPSNLPGYPGDCAVVIPSNGIRARHLRFVATKLWRTADHCGYGLAEIQAYSGDRNVAMGKPVTASDEADSGPDRSPAFVVDGFSSRHRLIELPDYLDLIARRGKLEREFALLADRRDHKLRTTGLVLGYGGGGLGSVAVLGWAWMLARQRQVRRQAVAQLRDQIARDLHDDIGSNLGGIVLLSEIGGKHSADPQSRADFLTIKEAADEVSASMLDIVWLIQRGHFGLRDLVTRMRQSARMILGDKEVSLKVEPPDFKDRNLSLSFRRHVFFAFKEALNNTRKHADARNIEVRIRLDSSLLTFIVRDDGIGFDPQAAELPGHGLSNLKRRAAKLKGSCVIESRPGRGSVVTFSVPLKS